jgi:hypothetical protein
MLTIPMPSSDLLNGWRAEESRIPITENNPWFFPLPFREQVVIEPHGLEPIRWHEAITILYMVGGVIGIGHDERIRFLSGRIL